LTVPTGRTRNASRATAEIRAAQPKFVAAVLADAKVTAAYRSERFEFRGRLDAAVQALRLAWRSDAFLAQVLYRAQARASARGIPVVPRVAHRLAMITAQLSIGEAVLVHPGVYFAHGQVVIDGVVEIHSGAVLNPWVAIGPRYADADAATTTTATTSTTGTTVESATQIGTGAIVIGAVTIGSGARIGANAVVLTDVAPGTTVVGIPARAGEHR
jgi:serine O-acetyltransferase